MIYDNEDLMRAMREAFLCGSQASLNDSKADPLKLADDYIADQRKRISPYCREQASSLPIRSKVGPSVNNNNDTPPQEVKPEDVVGGIEFVEALLGFDD